MKLILDRIAADIAAQDFGDIEREIAEIDENIAQLHAGLSRANDRMHQTDIEMQDIRRIDVDEIVDAFVAGEDGAAKRRSIEEIREERQTLSLALSQLRRRIESAQRQKVELAKSIKRRLSPLFTDIIQEIEDEAQRPAARLLELFTIAQAISNVVGIHGKLLNALKYAVVGTHRNSDHIATIRGDYVQVPTELDAIRLALDSITVPGAAKLPEQVYLPRN